MNSLLAALGFLAVGLAIAILIYLLTARRYQSSSTVANSYDQWTEDGILEFYWGEHIHLGHYGTPPRQKDFLTAKADFVHEMVRWAGLNTLPPGTTVLDVGCGIGGSRNGRYHQPSTG
jgi:MPBQ/MSBQ methyltransferase